MDHVYIPDDNEKRKVAALVALDPLPRDMKELVLNIAYNIYG